MLDVDDKQCLVGANGPLLLRLCSTPHPEKSLQTAPRINRHQYCIAPGLPHTFMPADSFTSYGWLVCLWILVTPFQYGYHISALNQIQAALTCSNEPPAVDELPACIPMSDVTFSMVTSVFTIGGLAGSGIANLITDGRGRKGALRVCSVLMAVGAALMGASSSVLFLMIGRFLIGVGSGIGICVGPIYIAEISPARISGRVGILTQVGVVLGIMTTQLVGLQFATQSQWRYVLYLSAVLGVAQFVLSTTVAESPIWLSSKGRLEERKVVAHRIWGIKEAASDAVEPLLEEGVDPLDAERPQESVKMHQLFTKEYRKPLMIVCFAMLAQQISGVNAVLYYSNDILSKSFPALGPYLSLGITVVNFVMTFPPIILMERMGRKQLLTLSAAGSILSLFLLGYGLNSGSVPLSSVTIVTFIMSFAIGMGPLPFVMIPEVSPAKAVSALSSVALSLNWIVNFLVGFLFLPLRNLLSGGDRYLEGRVFYVFGLLFLSSFVVLSRAYR
ncbi:hypothetical protein D9611_004518 [Ephemerocybe angulata]|uniref:Major facilitator superfamily (MFS) profile domain-containing protein n=1 Tax=Ephemerocybe angulata TaxID=980116 RepID=A0A8H5F5T6_9AGAR|nr:hypothetical protein D9611_004518 [Tulosesus angulatus]